MSISKIYRPVSTVLPRNRSRDSAQAAGIAVSSWHRQQNRIPEGIPEFRDVQQQPDQRPEGGPCGQDRIDRFALAGNGRPNGQGQLLRALERTHQKIPHRPPDQQRQERQGNVTPSLHRSALLFITPWTRAMPPSSTAAIITAPALSRPMSRAENQFWNRCCTRYMLSWG